MSLRSLHLKSTKSFFIASLFITAPLFSGEETIPRRSPTEQGHERSCNQLISGYNAPARIATRGTWDFYVTGSFIYWQARQENIEIGLISQNNPEGVIFDSPFTTSYVNNATITEPNFTYRPGFQLGLGINLDWDHWDVYAEYTWFHGEVHSRVKPLPPATTGAAIPPNGKYLYPIQGASLTTNDRSLFFQDANQSWSLKMDFLDLSLARNHYSGRCLTLRPFFGVRGAQVRQHVNTDYVGSTTYATLTPPSEGWTTAIVHNRFISWGIGPRAGFESSWRLGLGTHLIGNAAGDILYTRYQLHQDQQITFLNLPITSNPIVSNATVLQSIDYLRAHVDLEFGFGWGTYFDNYNWHVEFEATYGFQIFWNQNMFRYFENASTKSKTPNGNLYIHGLTLNANFNF
jgi:hypothetical protein